jgi:hypothetical protein
LSGKTSKLCGKRCRAVTCLEWGNGGRVRTGCGLKSGDRDGELLLQIGNETKLLLDGLIVTSGLLRKSSTPDV